MRLFADEHGQPQGWLAALLCCCAAMGDDEYPAERRRLKEAISKPSTCNTQPTPLKPMPTHSSMESYEEAALTEDDRVRPISERPPSLKPLDLGDVSLMSRMSLHGRRKSSTALLSSGKRISIGPPTAFRKLDYTEKQRRSLKPLQLEPVVLSDGEFASALRESAPEPNTARSMENLTQPANRHSHREFRERPLQPCQHMSASARCEPPPPVLKERPHTAGAVKMQRVSRPTLSTQSSSSSLSSLRRLAMEASNNTSSFRPSTERARLRRKRSNQSNRKLSSEDNDLDKEILELNTIVEERRAETGGPQSPDEHVPAVAPLMAVRARSQTLEEIGSAFSRPFRLETGCTTIAEPVSPVVKLPVRSRLSRPFTNMPDSNLTGDSVGLVRRPSSRVTGWLSNILSTSAPPSTLNFADTACRPAPVRRRAVSEVSLCTTVTQDESSSVSQTTTSSPHSKGHSRTYTGESSSRMTPISPPSTACTSDFDLKDLQKRGVSGAYDAEQWPTSVEHPSQVGLAL